MYRVLDVSRYIINYINDNDDGISNLKLQKILYFVQAYFLIEKKDSEPCFREPIEAWDFGPVVPEAYYEFKQFGSANIPFISTYFEFDSDSKWHIKRVKYDDSIIAGKDKELINIVVDKFSKFSATDLVTITHNQAPWKNAYKSGENNEITIEALRGYFCEW